MSLPAGLSTVTLTGTLTHPSGGPLKGRVLLTPEVAAVTSAEHGVIVVGPVEAVLDVNGRFVVELLATDATTCSPSGWTYHVDVLGYDVPARSFAIMLPASAPAVDLAAIAPTDPAAGAYVVVTGPAGAQGPAGPQGPPGDGGGGAVASVNDLTGAVVLDAADVGAIPVSQKGAAGGVATLSAAGIAPVAQRPPWLNSPWIENVQDHGALGDGTTDDTAAIQDAIDTAVATAQSSGTYYAEVYFPPAVYLLASAPTTTRSGNAQLALPIVEASARKVTLVLNGVNASAALPHWNQTSSQLNGAILKSTYQQMMDNTHGECSVVGGPTPQQGYGRADTDPVLVFDNLCVVVDGLQIQTKHDHSSGWICGFDFRGVAQAHVRDAAVMTDASPTTIVFPDNSGFEWGLAMPAPGNNAVCEIDQFSCEGFTYGVALTEHCAVKSIRVVYCYDGILMVGSFWPGGGAPQHNLIVLQATIEACTNAVTYTTAARGTIMSLDVENIAGSHIRDADGTPVGYVGLGGIINSVAVSMGGGSTRLRIEYVDSWPGPRTPPAVPSSGTALLNPFWRDAVVAMRGGTVTAISVDGTASGLTAGTVVVPSGHTVSWTGSAAPSWTWTLL